MQTRRDFFFSAAKAAGSVAVLPALLKADGLMAVPQDPVTIGDASAVWAWDGSPAEYLDRLNTLVSGHLALRGVGLHRLPQLGLSVRAVKYFDAHTRSHQIRIDLLGGKA